MRIDKAELAKRIDRIKNVVPKSSNVAALRGILLKDGCLIASNTEMTIKVKLQGVKGECFIIPAKAFDLIKNLPEGDLEITEKKGNQIMISMEKIKNTYSSLPSTEFPYDVDRVPEGGGKMSIDSQILREAMSHVLYAIPNKASNCIMMSLYMQAKDGKLNFVGLDGHVIAWTQMDFDGEFELLVPKSAVEKLLSLEMIGDVAIKYDKSNAIFRTGEYEIHTRLLEGEYFKFDRFFESYTDEIRVRRSDLLEAVTRAKLCTEELTPTKFEIEGTELKLSIRDRSADYTESVCLQSGSREKIVIGFNSRLVLETLKAHSGEEIKMRFGGSGQPMIVISDIMRSIVLPVRLR